MLPVTFALADGRIWSAIDDKPKRTAEPARLRFLRRDPRAALTVDRYSDDWEELAWVQVLGIGADRRRRRRRGRYWPPSAEKYDQYREQSPPGPLLALEPERYLWWRAADPEDRGGHSVGPGG